MKTFKELVTELKASTLGSYIKKASKDANDLAYIQGAAGSLNAPFERKKKHQRERGIETATDKLVKGQVTKEDVELGEEKTFKINSKDYITTSEPSQFGGHQPKIVHKKEGHIVYLGQATYNSPLKAKQHADEYLKGFAVAGERGARIKTDAFERKNAAMNVDDLEAWKEKKATDKLAKGKVTKEEIEELDELMVKDSEKAYELKNKIERLKKTHEKHVAALKALPDTAGNSEKRINLGMKIDGLKRNIKKHTEAHKKLAPSEYSSTNEQIDEVLTKSTPVGKWIHDFTKSDNPKFAGKSNKERIKMALGAFYGKQKVNKNKD